MIQSAQVASKFTLFTHHAKTFPNLVTALRNSMLRAGTFKDEKTAEEQVVQVLNFDIHLLKDFRGRRYIERITECIPVEEKNEYTFDYRKEKTLEGKLTKFMDNATIFFSKTTNRELYKYRNILEFSDDSYVLVNPISEYNIREMRNNMEENDVVAFDAFLERNWGIKPPKMPNAVDNTEDLELNTEPTQKVVDIEKDEHEVATPISTSTKNEDVNVTTPETTEEKTATKTIERPATPRQAPARPTQATGVRPTKPAGTPGGISKDAIRKSVGIKRPAGQAPVRPTTPKSTTKPPVRRPVTERPVDENPYKTDFSGLEDETEE